jgi:hypothetical protein
VSFFRILLASITYLFPFSFFLLPLRLPTPDQFCPTSALLQYYCPLSSSTQESIIHFHTALCRMPISASQSRFFYYTSPSSLPFCFIVHRPPTSTNYQFSVYASSSSISFILLTPLVPSFPYPLFKHLSLFYSSLSHIYLSQGSLFSRMPLFFSRSPLFSQPLSCSSVSLSISFRPSLIFDTSFCIPLSLHTFLSVHLFFLNPVVVLRTHRIFVVLQGKDTVCAGKISFSTGKYRVSADEL